MTCGSWTSARRRCSAAGASSSENVPFLKPADRINELDGAERVVTVCPHGEASVQAARLDHLLRGV